MADELKNSNWSEQLFLYIDESSFYKEESNVIIDYLLKQGADINFQTEGGSCPYLAITNIYPDLCVYMKIAKFLISRGAKVIPPALQSEETDADESDKFIFGIITRRFPAEIW